MPEAPVAERPVFQLYLDDSGSRLPDHKPDVVRKDGIDCFALGGVLIARDERQVADDLHAQFLSNWGIDGPLHSTEIRGKRGAFRWLGRDAIRAAKFYQELGQLLVDLPVIGFACAIDRPGYNARYEALYGEERWRMCKTAYSIVVERAAKYCRELGGQLEVFFEQCGEREDRDIQAYHKLLKQEGMPFNRERSADYDGLSADEFCAVVLGDPARRTKKMPMIQFADLYLYPMLKGGYEGHYPPYNEFMKAGRLIDSLVSEADRSRLGIKYSCFDAQKDKGPE